MSILAVAAVTLFSCVKAETEISKPEEATSELGIPFEFNAGTIETKTTNDSYSTYWKAGDEVNLIHKASSGDSYTNDGAFTAASNGSTSKFTGTVASAPTSGDTYVWYSLYPYDSDYTAPDGSTYTNIPSTQTQTGANSMSHLCGATCPLGGKSVATEYDATPSITMHNLTSIVKVVVKNKTAASIAVSKVVFTTSDNRITGNINLNLTGDSPVWEGNTYGSKTATLYVSSDAGIAPESTSAYYIAIRPFVAAAGTTIKLSVTTNNGEQEVTTDPLGANFEFVAGKIHQLNFNYNTAAPAAISTETDPLLVGFESSEGFASGTNYDKTYAQFKGASTTQWGIISGDVTATAAQVIAGSQSIAMWDYTKNSIAPEAYTNYRLSTVKEVQFKAKASDATYKVKLSYSIDNRISWTDAETFDLTTSSGDFKYTFATEKTNVAFKFTVVQPSTRVDRAKVSIDDVSFSKTAVAPAVTVATNAASNLKSASGTSATLNGTLALVYGATIENLTEAGFYYKATSAGPYTKVTCSPKPAAAGAYSYNLTGLTAGTEYTFYAYAIYDSGDEVVDTGLTFTPQAALQAVYTQTSTTAVSSTGTPAGSTAEFSNTYTNNKNQLTSGNSMTLTLHGYAGKKITGITLSMRSNNSSGAGTFSAVAGSTSLARISSGTTFNSWYDNTSYGSSYRDVHVVLTNSAYTIGNSEDVVITIAATANSLYCQSFTIEYE